MMKNTIKWPKFLLVLDILGAIIVAAGIIEYLDTGSLNSALFIVAGLLLMLPLTLHILKLFPGKGMGKNKPDGEH
tara:strand:- start:21643 stop:21867 length:225 start_codon:yes stop_codon:yes gene_type:complete